MLTVAATLSQSGDSWATLSLSGDGRLDNIITVRTVRKHYQSQVIVVATLPRSGDSWTTLSQSGE